MSAYLGDVTAARCNIIAACALIMTLLAAGSAPAQNTGTADVTVYAPLIFDSADIDEQVRFAWAPNNGQDFFRVVFSEFRTFGWETTTTGTEQTVLNFQFASPRNIGLTSGTWYWRVCAGWNETPGTCYLDDDIRTLDVTDKPLLTLLQAIRTTRSVVRRRYGKTPRVRCARVNRSEMLCRGDFRRRGRARVAVVEVEARADGIYYSVRLQRAGR